MNIRDVVHSRSSVRQMEFTGERFVPELRGQIAYEHFHRYCLALEFVEARDVLDVASGEGYGTALLAMRARRVVGVDIAEDAVRHARERYGNLPNVEFVNAPCTDLPFPEATFDVVVTFETLEHVYDQQRFLQEIRRVLKPDGLVILSSPNRKIYSEQAGHSNPFHVCEFDRTELKAALRAVFPQVSLFGQRMTFSSYVWPMDSLSYGEFKHYSDAAHHGSAEPPFEPEYFVAICSASERLVVPVSSLYTAASDDVMQEYHQRGRWGQSLEAELAERSREVQHLRRELERLRQLLHQSQVAEASVSPEREQPASLLRDGEPPEKELRRLHAYAEQHPNDARAYNDLGVLYFQQGDPETALGYFRKAVAVNYRFLTARQNVADTLIALGDVDEATMWYQGIVGEAPNDIDALVSLGALLKHAGRHTSASYYLRRALENDPNNVLARTLLGDIKNFWGMPDGGKKEGESGSTTVSFSDVGGSAGHPCSTDRT